MEENMEGALGVTIGMGRTGPLGSGAQGLGEPAWPQGPGEAAWHQGPGEAAWPQGPGEAAWPQGPGSGLWPAHFLALWALNSSQRDNNHSEGHKAQFYYVLDGIRS